MCADVAVQLFAEFGDKLSLPLISAVVLHERLQLLGATRTVDPVELEVHARRALQLQFQVAAPFRPCFQARAVRRVGSRAVAMAAYPSSLGWKKSPASRPRHDVGSVTRRSAMTILPVRAARSMCLLAWLAALLGWGSVATTEPGGTR